MGIRSSLIRLLLSPNRKVTAASSKDELLAFIKLLRPESTGIELIRVGGNGDGGYLVPDDFEGLKFCFSPGVSEIATFEDQVAADYSMRSFMADASVEKPPIENDYFEFQKKFLGTVDAGEFMRLETWVASKADQIRDFDLLLQMDIEGAEYGVLIDTSVETLKRFRVMVIEFHNIEMIANRSALELLRPVFEKIKNEFVVVHLHPNNYKSPVESHGIKIPRALEVTFLRKDRIRSHEKVDLKFPHPLDQPNLVNGLVAELPEIWYRQ